MDEEPKSGGWWRTVPGILTATAGIITAVTGLIVAIHQAGIFDGERQKVPQVQNSSIKPPKGSGQAAQQTADANKASSSGQGASYPLNLSSGEEIRAGDLVYKVLTARLDRYAPNKLSLRFEVRMTNNGRFPANFWASSFRVLVDGVPRAPDNNLDEVVDGHSAKDGIVEFVIPDSATDVGLQIGDVGQGAPTISIELKAANR